MDSFIISSQPSSPTSTTTTSNIPTSSVASSSVIDSLYNKEDYKLEPNNKSSAYIFKNNLFTRTLLPINKEKEREMQVKCTTCNKDWVVKVKGFLTSNFIRHYKQSHPNIAYNEKSELTRSKKTEILPTRESFFTNSNKRPRSNTILDFKEEDANIKILDFIVENNLSFNTIESNSFKELLNYYNTSTPIINRKKIRALLDSTYSRFLSLINFEITKNIETLGRFSLVLDIWTSKAQDAFLGIIISYINSDFELVYKLIVFKDLTEAHTGLYIFKEVMDSLNIYPNLTTDKFFSFTRDNARNNTTFITSFKSNYKETYNKVFENDIRCIAHIINLVVQDILQSFISNSTIEEELSNYTNSNISLINNNLAIEENQNLEENLLSNLIKRIRRITVLVKYTHEIKHLLLEGISRAKNEGTLPSNFNKKIIPIDHKIRWNSTYRMISTTIEFKPALDYIYRNTSNLEFKKLYITNSEYKALKDLESIFLVFLKPSTHLQSKLYINLNMGLLYIYTIYKKLDNLISKFTALKERSAETATYYTILINSIKKGTTKLTKYFPQKLDFFNLDTYKAHIISIVLDPRMKVRHFENNKILHHYPTIKKDIINLLEREYKSVKIEKDGFLESEEVLESNTYNSDSNNDFFISSNNTTTEAEYISYLAEGPLDQDIDPLLYWKSSSYKYPILAILARRYLAIPATSALIERVFSVTSNITTKNRNKLSPHTIAEIILLKYWKIKDLKELEEIFLEEEGEEEEED